jgi:malonyl-CoA/methylmalonyl-CoA synthetase
VTPGKTGQLLVRGGNVFKGYWRKPEKTLEEFTTTGFFKTGDLASMDEDGYISIVGRSKDLIITGGLNVYPKEIELWIDSLPDVIESAVIGIPHQDFGEAVTAIVIMEPSGNLSEQIIISHLKKSIANFKVPKAVHFMDQLPRNTMGKVQKNLLRETFNQAKS